MSDELIFMLVLLLRLGIPLLIPRFPFPAILAALVIDAADQTIFQNNTDLDLTNYQGYDKALDIYYLAIAYLSTFRNWADPFAARTAQFLWYYRLLGVMLFELFHERALLIIFPNTFEYFFIAYEVVRVGWNPARLGHRAVIILAACIWIFIKLPQEWWLHIAQLDFTDFMKEDVFGVTVETSWGDAISENLWFVGLIAVVTIGVVVGIRAALRAAPPRDWSPTLNAHAHPESTRVDATPVRSDLFSWDLLEKVVLTSMITIIFAQVIPSNDSTPLQLTIGVGFLVAVSAAASQWLAGRGHTWSSTLTEFVGMAVINFGIAAFYVIFLSRQDDDTNSAALLFFVLLLTLIIILFDRYRPIRSARWDEPDSSPQPA